MTERRSARARQPRAVVVAALLLCAGFSLLGASRASARKPRPREAAGLLVGKVVQVTASDVYLNLGARQGLRPGQSVELTLADGGTVTLKLADVWAKGARASLPRGPRLPARGNRVTAEVLGPVASAGPPKLPVKRLPASLPAAALAAKWEGVELDPPKRVPYRLAPVSSAEGKSGERRIRGSVRLEYAGLLDLGSAPQANYHQFGLYSDLDVPRLGVDWLDYSHRLRVRYQLAKDLDARPYQGARPIPMVYRLRLGLETGRFRAEVGRTAGGPLPEAGVVDGGTARARVTDWLAVGAFGGLAPKLLTLYPGLEATRFGGYLSARLASPPRKNPWSLSADVGFVGSTYRGALDRKAVSAQVAFDLRTLSLYALATVDLYGGAHPASLGAVDLTEAVAELAADATSWLHLGLRYDRYRYVPSREALDLLPGDVTRQDPVNAVRAFFDLRLPKQLVVSVQAGFDRQGGDSWGLWGEAALRASALLAADDQLHLAFLTQQGSTLTSYGGRLRYDLPLASWLSLGGGYALHLDRFSAQEAGILRHTIFASGELLFGRHWIGGVHTETLLSGEEQALQLFATVAYHY
ncbi:MAG: hypothetical protein IT371_05625 [Deltaproteobacteria bacterium]|nr:hypothetical protein [Deltaproteobacteria bacterium]